MGNLWVDENKCAYTKGRQTYCSIPARLLHVLSKHPLLVPASRRALGYLELWTQVQSFIFLLHPFPAAASPIPHPPVFIKFNLIFSCRWSFMWNLYAIIQLYMLPINLAEKGACFLSFFIIGYIIPPYIYDNMMWFICVWTLFKGVFCLCMQEKNKWIFGGRII